MLKPYYNTLWLTSFTNRLLGLDEITEDDVQIFKELFF